MDSESHLNTFYKHQLSVKKQKLIQYINLDHEITVWHHAI